MFEVYAIFNMYVSVCVHVKRPIRSRRQLRNLQLRAHGGTKTLVTNGGKRIKSRNKGEIIVVPVDVIWS